MYSLHTEYVNKVEAVTLNVRNPIKKFNAYIVIKGCLNVLTMVINYKHIHAKCFTPLNTVNKWYEIFEDVALNYKATRDHGLLYNVNGP